MRFKLGRGPWQLILEGRFHEFDLSVYANQKSVVLAVILEKKGDKVVGAVVEPFKVFSASGEMEDFIETFPREAQLFVKHDKKLTRKFFTLSAGPEYTRYSEDEFCSAVEKMIDELEESTEMVLEVSKAYDLELKELQKTDEETREAFLAEPIVFSTLMGKSTVSFGGRALQVERPTGEIVWGLTREGLVVREPLALFNATGVSGASERERNHAVHLLIEGVLLNNSPAVVFAWDDSFDSVNKPSPRLEELQKFKVELEPIGFPVKVYTAGSDIKVDLNLLEPRELLELFGVGKNPAAEGLAKFMSERKGSSLEELAEDASRASPEGELNQFEVFKMARVLRLISQRYPGLFGVGNNAEEIVKKTQQGVGRLGIVKLHGLDKRSALMVVHSLLRALGELHEKKGFTSKVRAAVMLPEAQKIIGSEQQTALGRGIIESLESLKELGIGHCISAERQADLLPETRGLVATEVFIISLSDVGIRIEKRKQYRVKLRPGLSDCCR